eukprot:TRINITY_DN7886_c0_g1_i12.p5 TRINITY_DN7886_c0_g1~~TRINITY_DN7886_c0_g1_i12.p5  ORF type:complete len:103 (-),score=26.15 TRINITY_DN7886_c0_g1_i12:93-401(-)
MVFGCLRQARTLFIETSQYSKKLSNTILLATVLFLAIYGIACATIEMYCKIHVFPLQYPTWIFELAWELYYAVFVVALAASLLPEERNVVESVEVSESNITI